MRVPLISNVTPFKTSTEVSSHHIPVGDAVELRSLTSEAGFTVRSMPCTHENKSARTKVSGGGRIRVGVNKTKQVGAQ